MIDLHVEAYKKAALVKGKNTSDYVEELRSMGGKWNGSLRGWIYSGKKLSMLEKWVKDKKSGKPIVTIKVSPYKEPKKKSQSPPPPKKKSPSPKKSTSPKKKSPTPKKKSPTPKKKSPTPKKAITPKKSTTPPRVPTPKKSTSPKKKSPSPKKSKSPLKDVLIVQSELKIDMRNTCVVPPKTGKNMGHDITPDNACSYYIKHGLSDHEIKHRWNIVMERAREKIPENLVRTRNGREEFVTCKDLSYIFEIFDSVYFNGSLWKTICTQHATLGFKLSNRKAKKAGHCSRKGCQYEIVLFLPVFTNIFTKPTDQFYNSNGISCKSRLECLLNVFAHELCHLILERFCHVVGQTEKSHGPTFQKFARHLFGQTAFRHALMDTNVNMTEEKADQRAKVVSLYKKTPNHIFHVDLNKHGGKQSGIITDIYKIRAKFLSTTGKVVMVPYRMFEL
jgi:hypothetical protein